ncbi:5'-3' exonuclease [Deinococcus pimensis]|uniref:5'-3' exonuclease n=1 Tax=Deinococcus pimensis TaxID=309888 RepID=UPI0004B48D96|nr:5'-3' exonuclease H3TH domain-containing protein [Deinococcus pimensis]
MIGVPCLLVDAPNIAHRVWHSHRRHALHETLTERYQRVLTEHARALGATRRIAAVERTRSFRYEIVPGYKANRPARPPELRAFIDALPALSAEAGFEVWHAPDHEADDVLATFAASLDGGLIILSTDQDLYACVNDRVRVAVPHGGGVRLVDHEGVVGTYGVPPEKVPLYLALVGDPSDNLRGVRGMGARRAAPLLARFSSLDALYGALHELDDVPRKLLGRTPRSDVEACLRAATLVTDAPLERLHEGCPDERETGAARRSSTAPETLRAFIERHQGLAPSDRVDASTPREVLRRHLDAASFKARLGMLGDPACPNVLMDVLAEDASETVRRLVAWRASASATLQRFANDVEGVRHALARNPACPPEVLEHLASSTEATVLTALARHPTLSSLPGVRLRVAVNPACPADVRSTFLSDACDAVRQAAATAAVGSGAEAWPIF